jgi:hypothetical protein
MERSFRFWLACELLHDKLLWDYPDIFVGDIFDILLIAGGLRPVIYIETKAPLDRLVIAGRDKFLLRIPGWPTLSYAIFTNGWIWEKYHCSYIDNQLCVNKKSPEILNMEKNLTDDIFQTFFSPLSKKWFVVY